MRLGFIVLPIPTKKIGYKLVINNYQPSPHIYPQTIRNKKYALYLMFNRIHFPTFELKIYV